MKDSLPLVMVVLSLPATAQQPLSISNLDHIGVQFEEVEYKKKKGLRMIE